MCYGWGLRVAGGEDSRIISQGSSDNQLIEDQSLLSVIQ